jgi:hypothetical protein
VRARSLPLVALAAPVLALAAPPPASALLAPNAGAEGACERAEGAASSEAALLMSPELFASLGVVSASLNGDALGAPTPRLLVGADYSLSRLLQGMTLKEQAAAACAKARALAALAPEIALGDALGRLPALTARGRALQEAMPRAEALVREVASEVEEGRASREELNALAQAMDALRQLAHQTRVEAAKLSQHPPVDPRAFRAELAALRAANVRYASLGGSLRAKRAWDLAVRGGYEELFDVDQSVPVFGMVTVSYNLGGLFQGSANRRAVEGAGRELDTDATGPGQALRQLVEGLKAQLALERARREETRTRLTDLEGQARQLEAITTHEVDRFRRSVFFQEVQARAELAYLEAHVHALEALVQDTP